MTARSASIGRLAITGVLSWLFLGCGDERISASDPLPDELGRLDQAIIFGLPAPSPQLDHTGALVYRVRATGETAPLCTASLIGPQTLVTAKHCIVVLPTFERIGIDVLWARGADANNPVQLIPIVAAAGAPGDEPGFAGYGRDVAVAHLDHPPEGVAPIEIVPFSRELLGASLVTLGYGVSSAGGLIDGLRRVGRETVSAIEGNAYAALFGDFESFVELVATGEMTDSDILPRVEEEPTLVDLEALRREYDAGTLLSEHEVVAGKAASDTQSCEIDSGGPLGRVNAEGLFETYGVVSAGPRLERPICALGQVFATFGPVTLPFLEAARAWEDPCGDVAVAGQCAGSVLQRCDSSFAAGLRRLANVDCAADGQRCVSAGGAAGCVPSSLSAADAPLAPGADTARSGADG
jgi:hypothetical protein